MMRKKYLQILIIMVSLIFTQNDPELFNYNQSTLQGFYFFDSVSINNIHIDEDDWVGAFKNGLCVGARKWDTTICGGGICDVPVMGNDGSEYTLGYMLAGETPTFKIYDASENIYYDAETQPETCQWNISSFCSLEQLFYEGEIVVEGCTDEFACNYDAQANQDNGTCEYPEQNFDCYGDCLVEEDCLGVCNGPAEIDECGICNGYGISQECGCGPPGEYGFPDDSCNCDGDVEDCLGICGGDATIDCNGVCDGDANCNINISLAPNEFENLVLLTNLNIEEIQESICIDSAQFSTINELNVEIGGCIEVNNAETIQIYITNEFYITDFVLSLSGIQLDSSNDGANGGILNYIGYDWDIVGNTILGSVYSMSDFIINLTSNCIDEQSCNAEAADINDESLCIYPDEYWFDVDSDGLGYGDSILYCLDELPNGWVMNNNDLCPNDSNNDIDGDGLCYNEDEYPDCYANFYDCAGLCGGDAFIDDCESCVGGDTGLSENYLNLGCGCNIPAAQDYWQDLDGDELGSGTLSSFCINEVPEGWISVNDSEEDPYPNCYDNFYDECLNYWNSLGIPEMSCGGSGILDGNCDCAGNTPIIYCIDSDNDNFGNANPDTWVSLCNDEYQNYTDILIPVEGGQCSDENEDCIADIDSCGICDGNNENQDCNNNCFGSAEIDDCGVCSGGETGLNPNADQDDCGVCDGENADKDCLGNCFGSAEIDDCGVCDGNIYLDQDGELYNGIFCDCELTEPNNCGECIEEECGVSALFANLNNNYKNSIDVPIYLNGYSNSSTGLEGIEFQFTYNSNYYDLNTLIMNEELIGYTLEYNNYTLNDSINKVEVIIYSSDEPITSLSQSNIVNLEFILNNQEGNYGYLHNKTTDLTFVDDFKIGQNIIETSNGIIEFKTIMCLDSFASNFCNNENPDFPSIPENECSYYNNPDEYVITDGLCEYRINIPIENGVVLVDTLLANGDSSIELFISSETIIINDEFDGEILFSEFYNTNILPNPLSEEGTQLTLIGDVISFEPYELLFEYGEFGQVTINMSFIPIGQRGEEIEYELYKLNNLTDENWERVETGSCGESACSAQINSFGLYSVVTADLGCTEVDACNYNESAIVNDGSCILPEDYGIYCYDGEGDGWGYECLDELVNQDENDCYGIEYYCPDLIPENWVNNCFDQEPLCINTDPNISLTDNCGVCNGNNECFEYPDEFVDSWILIELNQYNTTNCYAEDDETIISETSPFNIDSIYQLTNENSIDANEDCLSYKMILQYNEPCQWSANGCSEVDNDCAVYNQEICEYNDNCIWEYDLCVELNNNCNNIITEDECLSKDDYSNLAQLVCVTNEIYDEEFGGGWIYDEEVSDVFEWGVGSDQLCFNDYGINDYSCIDFAFANNQNELRLQFLDGTNQCNENKYQRDSYLSINSSTLIPEQYKLYSSYPNPFNPTTRISFDIPKSDYISLDIYNINGQHIETIINEYLPPGHYKFDFNGIELPTGIYFTVLQSKEFYQSNKMILIK